MFWTMLIILGIGMMLIGGGYIIAAIIKLMYCIVIATGAVLTSIVFSIIGNVNKAILDLDVNNEKQPIINKNVKNKNLINNDVKNDVELAAFIKTNKLRNEYPLADSNLFDDYRYGFSKLSLHNLRNIENKIRAQHVARLAR